MAETIDPDEYTKPELQELAADAGVPTSGTKAEIAERLAEADVESEPEAPTEAVIDGRAYADLSPEEQRFPEARDEERIDTKLNGDVHPGAELGGDVTAADFEKHFTAASEPPAEVDVVDTTVPGEATQASTDAEFASKEGAQGDGREKVTDFGGGKSLDQVLENAKRVAEGEEGGVPPTQYYRVQGEYDLIGVAHTLGLPDHSELAALNGRYNGILNVQEGQLVVLPNHYRFDGIDGVTEDPSEEPDEVDDDDESE